MYSYTKNKIYCDADTPALGPLQPVLIFLDTLY
jgi:hypothetical protein